MTPEAREGYLLDLTYSPSMSAPKGLSKADRAEWRLLKKQVREILDRGDLVEIPLEMVESGDSSSG